MKSTRLNPFQVLRDQLAIMSFYERFEQVVALVLSAVIAVIIVVSLFQLIAIVFTLLVLDAFNPLDHKVFQSVFGMIMTLLIAMEFKHSIVRVALRRDSIIQVKTVVLIALIALSRKFVILDSDASPAKIAALASHAQYEYALTAGQRLQTRVDLLIHLDAQRRTDVLAGLYELRHHAHNGIDRHRKAYAGRGARRTVDGGIDSDQPPSRIEQRATGIAGVDGGVGLDQVIDGRAARFSRQRAVERGDDTSGERPVQAEGVADSEHLLTSLSLSNRCLMVLLHCPSILTEKGAAMFIRHQGVVIQVISLYINEEVL